MEELEERRTVSQMRKVLIESDEEKHQTAMDPSTQVPQILRLPLRLSVTRVEAGVVTMAIEELGVV